MTGLKLKLILECILYLDHQCNYPGCHTVLVIDGNMKNRRDVCAASEAGYTEYEGLPGAIKTGCQRSPGYQSKYCHEHSPRITSITSDEEAKPGVVGVISAKKQTRSGLYYQVNSETCPRGTIMLLT